MTTTEKTHLQKLQMIVEKPLNTTIVTNTAMK